MGGWLRIGIVVSVIWALVGGFWGNKTALDDAAKLTNMQLDTCVSKNKGLLHSQGDDSEPYDKIWTPCWAEHTKNFMTNVEGRWWSAAFVGVVPIPLAWLVVYMLVGVYRWIRRGFARA